MLPLFEDWAPGQPVPECWWGVAAVIEKYGECSVSQRRTAAAVFQNFTTILCKYFNPKRRVDVVQ